MQSRLNQGLKMQNIVGETADDDERRLSTAAGRKDVGEETSETRWRTPIGFGPAPGPRQPLGLSLDSYEVANIRRQTPETSSLLSIRFKSSRTFLQNLLPPRFTFINPDTICEATLLCNTLNGMVWLGGGGYNYIMLCLHGVQYTRRTGENMFGTFLPLLLENLADPIVTGRDDLGMPKLYAAIDVQLSGDKATVQMTWRGTNFGKLTFGDLSSAEKIAASSNGDMQQDTLRPDCASPHEDNGVFL